MKKIICDKVSRIRKGKLELERKLNIKISFRGKEVYIEGESEDEYLAEKVIEALNFGFPFSVAVLIKEADFNFEILNIKDYTKRKNLKSVRARIIGKKGKTLSTLSNLTNCNFELNKNEVGIIGSSERIENAQNAVISLVQGSKQSNVYGILEKHKLQPIEDLGLRE